MNGPVGAQDHDYFEHDADIGVVGRGGTPEEAFVGAARAMFALQTELGALRSKERFEFTFVEDNVELALVIWLNRLLGEARIRGLALADFGIRREGERWCGWAAGECWREDIVRGTEVKGATLTMLSVNRVAQGWEARCVVDV